MIALNHVWHWGQKAFAVFRSKSRNPKGRDVYLPLLDLHAEGRLLREIKDISEELDIMLTIIKRQQDLIRQFCRHVENILDPERQWAETRSDTVLGSRTENHQDHRQNNLVQEPVQPIRNEAQDQLYDRGKRKAQLVWFRLQSQDLLNKVQERIAELEDLRASAKSTEQSVICPHVSQESKQMTDKDVSQVVDLLTLKQQQASVVQIASLTNAEETVRQGRAIMMFTIVTIVFVSFLYAVGMIVVDNVSQSCHFLSCQVYLG